MTSGIGKGHQIATRKRWTSARKSRLRERRERGTTPVTGSLGLTDLRRPDIRLRSYQRRTSALLVATDSRGEQPYFFVPPLGFTCANAAFMYRSQFHLLVKNRFHHFRCDNVERYNYAYQQKKRNRQRAESENLTKWRKRQNQRHHCNQQRRH